MRIVMIATALLLIAATAAAQQTGAISGLVRDDAGGALPGVTVTARSANGTVTTASTGDGTYRVDALAPGTYTVEFALPNYAIRRRPAIVVHAGEATTVDAVLTLTLTADVSVVARRTFRNLAEIDDAVGGLLGIANSASEGLVTANQFDARPIMRTGEVLEAVPGLVVSQHSAEGKANQYYLRGFNLDHGTDFATTVGGVPVNMPTHAHGQGYSDVNFLIPELVTAMHFQKGLYSAEQGDFATAGSSHVRYANVIEEPLVRASVGEGGWRRLLAAASPRAGRNGHVLMALEVTRNDGPWERPDGFDKLNGVLGFSRGDTHNGFTLNLMAYSGEWDSTDQTPRRAVESGVVSRFGAIDTTTGGSTARYSLSGDWQRTRGTGATRANAFAMRYRLNLFSNFTYFLDDPENGDQFEQVDRRWVSGGRLVHRQLGTFWSKPVEWAFGGEVRRDAIGEVGLYRTAARARLSTVRQDAVTQSSAGTFVHQELQLASWARSSLGIRADGFWFDVNAADSRNGGSVSDGMVSPKASLIFGPWKATELYVSTGTGFHSNDARGTTITVDPVTGDSVERVTPLVRARGAEIGLRTVPRRGLHATVAVWTLSLDSELLFEGDAGTTDAGRPSRRTGIETTAFYSVRPWLTLDADLALTRARFEDGDPAERRIPGALDRVIAGGATVHGIGAVSGSVRVRHFGPRDLVEDGSVRSNATTLVNGQLEIAATRHSAIVFDVFNLFDAQVSDIDYFYRSRLPGETADGVDDVHSHPPVPRTIRLGMRVRF